MRPRGFGRGASVPDLERRGRREARQPLLMESLERKNEVKERLRAVLVREQVQRSSQEHPGPAAAPHRERPGRG